MTGLQNSMLVRIPRSAAHVETEVIGSELLVYHPQDTRAVYLNATAAAIWGLSDGSRTVSEIIRIIAESYPDADSLTDDVLVTLNLLQECGILVIG